MAPLNGKFQLHRTQTRQQAVDMILTPAKDVTRQDVQGKKILLRTDLNVPIDKDTGAIQDDTRIRGALPTIMYLARAGAKVVVCSHLGRPDPSKQSWEEMKAKYSLARVADELANQLGGLFIGLAPDCIGAQVTKLVDEMQPGQVLLLENTRFHNGETKNDDGFAKALAANADMFVSDGFGVVHRDQASVTGVTKFIKASYPGMLIRKEVQCLAERIDKPKRPFAVVLGGAKVVDKIHIIKVLLDKADIVLIGGKMAFTFLKARGLLLGRTDIEEAHQLEVAKKLEEEAEAKGVKLLLPVDQVVGDSLEAGANTSISVLCNGGTPCIPEGWYGGDIGPKTAQLFASQLSTANTIFWNGPMGKFEVPEYREGTCAVARAMAEATARGAVTIIGGGDSVYAVRAAGLTDKDFSHISTGGGAALELIEGNKMPGLRALTLGVAPP